MPQDTKTQGHEYLKPEGNRFRPKNFAELVDAVEAALDYRGDVTIETRDGQVFEGYVFNRERDIAEPYVQMFRKNHPGQTLIHYHDIAGIVLTGEDMAFGRSWEAWTKKNAEQRAAEAVRLAAEAAARGHL